MIGVFTIPAHRAFADALAEGLLKTYGAQPLGLARGIVLVPTNRAARALTDAFVRRAEGGLLLPRLVPIGDPELDERVSTALDTLGESIPPAIEPMRRRMILARLVQDERARAGRPVDAAEAIRLATDLARTLDQLLVEEIEPRRLKALEVESELQEHWQTSLNLLTLVLDRWPEELARLGRIDLAERRNRVLGAVDRRWRATPPPGFVVSAGVTTTAPAIARLLKTVAGLPNGMVVLPGLSLEREMPEAEWRALGPFAREPGQRPQRGEATHPQHQLKVLLERMSIGRGEVETWRFGGGRDARAPRSRAIANALAPARFTGKWALPETERGLSGLVAIEAATPAEEAQAIAIALREALETPGKTAALVTPDRALATRVSAHLARWGITADDSAGEPLSLKPEGALLLAMVEAAAEGFAPAPLLALLKHPLVNGEGDRLAWLDDVRLLDLALRGPRPPAGLAGIDAYLDGGVGREREPRRRARAGWARIRPPLAALELATPDLARFLAALREGATALAGARVWAGPAGRAAADLLGEIEAHVGEGPGDARLASLVPMLRAMMGEVAVRPQQGGHPRIAIWGLIEARLQQADLVILGGLNEGVWPPLPSPDPWLAPRARAELGLPDLERRIGLAAHDFAQALGSPKVIVTRARRDASGPTVASRFWLRLAAMRGGRRWEGRGAGLHLALARALDTPAGPPAPVARPAPRPPLAARPNVLSVTQVDRLNADPFAFYAQSVLKLSALDAVDADASAAWRGTAIHQLLEDWAGQDWRRDALIPLAEALFARPDTHPLLRAFWRPRVMEVLGFVAEELDLLRDAEGRRPLFAERSGQCEIAGVTLKGKIDRLDTLPGGRLAVVDYKTGAAPRDAAVVAGFAMQLGLLGLIAEHGGFEGAEGRAAAFEYWCFTKNGDKFGKRSSPAGDKGDKVPVAEFTRRAEAQFGEAARRWLTGDAPFTAKLHPDYAPYGDYDQLMRLEEWYGR